ncbi:MAG: outer membrane protein assembly factor BamD, partial [Planctomycetales bacterium]|nr:outer membrane protein assembly factor BamD [Planctomycetales bacterium]
GSAYFAKGDFRNADRMFTDLRRTYPESPHMFEATLLSVKSKIKLYQGADYDSQHLEQSQDMIRMLLEQFPEESGEHREYLENAYKDVRLKLATRDWDTAKFFDNRGEYGGARYYYSKVLRDFPDTSLATESQDRLAAIAQLPDKPEQRAEWLTDFIPEHKNQHKPLIAGDPFDWFRR